MSTFACATNSNKVALQKTDSGTGRQAWTLEPLAAGVRDITNKTVLQVKVGSRCSACDVCV